MLADYIKQSWKILRRNALDVALDPKVSADRRSYLYIPTHENAAAVNRMIVERRSASQHAGALEVRVLPDDFSITDEHGILYLPNDYVVPGGRFNEMYGWDSYWIILGLMQDGETALALGIVENFLYMINNYGGKILNANRTYYLSRSQPPMLMLMAQAVLPCVTPELRDDFLRRVADAAALEYEGFWKTWRFDKEWGLFRYGNIEQGTLGLCPEVAFGERDDKGLSHYDKIAAYLRALPPDASLRQRYFDPATDGLSVEAIAGDRAMRESGFDASMHMGYYGLETMDFSPSCLNSLLFTQCRLLSQTYKELGLRERAQFFEREATEIQAAIHRFLWNDEAKLFLNFNHRENRHASFVYLTCVYPLWAGIATPEQARHFLTALPVFETEFGLKGNEQVTGCQWDAPFMWAPLVYFAVGGLLRYGFADDARRIAQKFIDTVTRVYDDTGANFEKYNADSGGIHTAGIIDVGYSENVVGFGWTNGTAAVFLNWLQTGDAAALACQD